MLKRNDFQYLMVTSHFYNKLIKKIKSHNVTLLEISKDYMSVEEGMDYHFDLLVGKGHSEVYRVPLVEDKLLVEEGMVLGWSGPRSLGSLCSLVGLVV